jgi:hypothetical protein
MQSTVRSMIDLKKQEVALAQAALDAYMPNDYPSIPYYATRSFTDLLKNAYLNNAQSVTGAIHRFKNTRHPKLQGR